ncbi:PSD1 and planctomycete cytochrome C domain-containing protein [Echinicola salinicaeni]|uniref:PSD1 and planctomycete cytochrome C domain-containing protein n=1 Tax=Echinicola salinicaeni TaxID=2762757 RepID=UPI001E3A0D16|nr:PSD1 and planctomycete cytochrome C domain-containing protein [Echinicola salinicaeni]
MNTVAKIKSLKNIIPLSLTGAMTIFAFSFSCNHKEKEKVDFNAEIRPIINNKCISCHGGVKQSGEFSLLFESEALSATKSGEPAIIPGHAEESEMIKRILHEDPEVRMPPEGPPLSKEEVEVLKKWINQGAKWEDHWSFIPPQQPELPEVSESDWAKNPIDAFVLEKMEEKGLSPSPQASPASLARRLSLDLTGLPPTEELVQRLKDNPDLDNYEKIVDELLASPQYGERWAAMWMDLARYADTKGYQKDRHRPMWKFRDWVIDAFNQNMPFDQFTIEQIAGDLLPDPSKEQLIATGFHRNTMTNDESGTDDEEFRVAAVLDRVNTTWEVWQGITFACVQCHSHPYDPIKHEEFYEFYAFFNNTKDADTWTDSPTLPVYTKIEEQERQSILKWIDSVNTLAPQTKYQFAHQIEEKETKLKKIKPDPLPVMSELPEEERRKTFVFERGNWMEHGKEVQPGVPGSMPDFPESFEKNRLGLAKWLVSKENPLTARVTVNRVWAQLFGKGIVETQEDFGSQGFAPTHPELLDWMATNWMHEQNWQFKPLLKMMVMSATYRQSSEVSKEALEKDAANYWLSRGPRVRLTAEQVRDQALAVSGLLSKKMFGPSVMPPQPDGVWQVINNPEKWILSKGEDQHRRGIYTYWRRTSPYPSMVSFDSPSREFCVNRRIRTNTPLQALVTMNDPVYVEAAQALAKRMRSEGDVIEEQLSKGYEMALFHQPDQKVLASLKDLYQTAYQHFKESGEGLENLGTKQMDTELNALTMTANAILNLDGFITKD